jgi:RecB family exonuclease
MIRNRIELAKRWYPKEPADEIEAARRAITVEAAWEKRALAALERVITKHNATLNDPNVPGYIKEGWMRRLPKWVKPGCTVAEYRKARYAMTEQQADYYYQEHVVPCTAGGEQGKFVGRIARVEGRATLAEYLSGKRRGPAVKKRG